MNVKSDTEHVKYVLSGPDDYKNALLHDLHDHKVRFLLLRSSQSLNFNSC